MVPDTARKATAPAAEATGAARARKAGATAAVTARRARVMVHKAATDRKGATADNPRRAEALDHKAEDMDPRAVMARAADTADKDRKAATAARRLRITSDP